MSKNIIYKNFIQNDYLDSRLNNKLKKSFSNIFNDIFSKIDDSEDMFHTFNKNFKFNFKIKDLQRFKKYKTIVVIGMGGSILGSEAIYSFLKKKIKKNCIFLNDIDQSKIKSFKNLNQILFIVISKSGNTIETLTNFLAMNVIKKSSKNIIIITEKRDSSLYDLSKRKNLYFIEHKMNIGGRYSVFSETGAIPAYLMGINIKKLRKNLSVYLIKDYKIFLKESAIKLSNLLKKEKFKNLILFNYVPELDALLYWLQQLLAESLGKKGKGFLPTVSKAPKDHHSLLQLYLDGPRDKIFYIFSHSSNGNRKNIYTKNLNHNLKFLNNKNLNQIKNAQKTAFIDTLKKNKLPFREFKIKNLNEEALGELLSYFILETVLIAKLVNINPFNQPAVEQVKVITKKLLS